MRGVVRFECDVFGAKGKPAVCNVWCVVSSEVRELSDAVTREIAQGKRRADLDGCQTVLDDKLGKTKDSFMVLKNVDFGLRIGAIRRVGVMNNDLIYLSNRARTQ